MHKMLLNPGEYKSYRGSINCFIDFHISSKVEYVQMSFFFQEMNLLFEKADYGMQYRALSHTGAILGSMADIGSPSGNGQQETEQNNHAKQKN